MTQTALAAMAAIRTAQAIRSKTMSKIKLYFRPIISKSRPASSGPTTPPKAIRDPTHDPCSSLITKNDSGAANNGKVGEVQARQQPLDEKAMFAGTEQIINSDRLQNSKDDKFIYIERLCFTEKATMKRYLNKEVNIFQ